MKILGIDTSTKYLGIAVANENSILAEHRGEGALRHSQDFIPNIDVLLKKINASLKDIDCFAISIGPGSFTGLRVGVSLVKGLSIVTNVPIVAVPTLDVIAYNAQNEDADICVVVDAKKGNLYASLYRRRNGDIIRQWDYLLVTPAELIGMIKNETVFLGDGVERYGDIILKSLKDARLMGERFWYPDVKIVCVLAREKLRLRDFTDPDAVVPMYIYSKECNVRGIDI